MIETQKNNIILEHAMFSIFLQFYCVGMSQTCRIACDFGFPKMVIDQWDFSFAV